MLNLPSSDHYQSHSDLDSHNGSLTPDEIPVGPVFMISQSGKLEMCTPEIAELLGHFDPTGPVGSNLLDWIPPVDHEKILSFLNPAGSFDQTTTLTTQLVHLKRNSIPVNLIAKRLYSALENQAHWLIQVKPVRQSTKDDPQISPVISDPLSSTIEALRQSEERLRLVISNLPVALFAVDCGSRFTLAEGKAFLLLGQTPGKIVGKSVQQVFPNHAEFEHSIRRAMNGENFNLRLDMTGIIFEMWCSPLRDSNGEIQGMLSVAFDVTEQKRTEEALQKSEERYRTLVENQGEGVCIISSSFIFEYVNLATEVIVGRPVEDLVGHSLLEILPPDQIQILDNQMTFRQKGKPGSYELIILRPEGKRRNLLVTSTPRFDLNGNFIGSFAVFRDITDRKRTEDHLHYHSYHDSLTGLYNRFSFEEEVARLEKKAAETVTVVMVDIDNLKEINDNEGHLIGDEAIRRVATALQMTFRAEDMIARFGGDEFIILLQNTSREGLTNSIERLHQNLSLANLNWESHYPISISIGGVVSQAGESLHETIAKADHRMYLDKKNKKGRLFLSPDL